MAEGTTLHNLLAKQMAEGKIGPSEKGTRQAANFIVGSTIKTEGLTGVRDARAGAEVDSLKSKIKAARKFDGK